MHLIQMNMIEQQIRPWAVEDARTLAVLRKLPRENFISKPFNTFAYADLEIPIVSNKNEGENEVMVSTLSPKVEAKIVQAFSSGLVPAKGKKIIVVGLNSPYLIAMLLELGFHVSVYEEDSHVFELFSPILKERSEHASSLVIYQTSFFKEYTSVSPHDGLIFCAALPEFNERYFDCVKEKNSIVFAVVGQVPCMEACLWKITEEGRRTKEVLFETSIPYLLGAPQKKGFFF